mmetsp:Transcript_14028/g.28839  ORF Transcript_14028/g.28839 Transcript_14028/m.28839 type:complete len:127 (-) Transcript_14028:147-527(-)
MRENRHKPNKCLSVSVQERIVRAGGHLFVFPSKSNSVPLDGTPTSDLMVPRLGEQEPWGTKPEEKSHQVTAPPSGRLLGSEIERQRAPSGGSSSVSHMSDERRRTTAFTAIPPPFVHRRNPTAAPM